MAKLPCYSHFEVWLETAELKFQDEFFNHGFTGMHTDMFLTAKKQSRDIYEVGMGVSMEGRG